MNITHTVWDATGRDPHPKATDTPGTCLICGATWDRTLRAKDGCGANFDYRDAKAPTDRVCEPCAYVLSGKPPKTFRMWNTLVDTTGGLPPNDEKAPYPSDGRVHLCNRKNMGTIVFYLTEPQTTTWAACIAVSGQKHILPYTPVNRPSADRIMVRFEATNITTTPQEMSQLIGAVAALRLAGHGVSSIHTATPTVPALTREGLAAWKKYGPRIGPHAGSPILGLAIHLTTKETLNDLADHHG